MYCFVKIRLQWWMVGVALYVVESICGKFWKQDIPTIFTSRGCYFCFDLYDCCNKILHDAVSFSLQQCLRQYAIHKHQYLQNKDLLNLLQVISVTMILFTDSYSFFQRDYHQNKHSLPSKVPSICMKKTTTMTILMFQNSIICSDIQQLSDEDPCCPILCCDFVISSSDIGLCQRSKVAIPVLVTRTEVML